MGKYKYSRIFRQLFLIVFLGFATLGVHQPALANKLTATTALGWDKDTESLYVTTSILMAAIVSANNDLKQSHCINDWYFGDKTLREKRIQELRGLFKQYPAKHPSVIILAALERQCGKLVYTKKAGE